ncbi:DUF3108 domain-containing protein [Tepidamorphus sp. 3E244]|uniref:DUF3108 domain-containing protein n=1 Tax=Tepidamorphus sp. 3E244 TaxID=3385498 RepID=UPI0038FCF368
MALASFGAPTTAQAASDGHFAVGYTVTLNGLALGRGSFAGRTGGGAYRLRGDASLAGIANWFFDYKAFGEVDGRLGDDNHRPRNFGSTASDGKLKQTVAMSFAKNRVRDMELNPPDRPLPGRVNLKSGHMRDVVDPMTALIITSTAKDGALRPADCNRRIPVFNGRERFDFVLKYKSGANFVGTRGKTYNGPVIICQALYKPVAGHMTGRSDVSYFASQKGMEVWLAPAGNTGMLVPVRMVVPTPVGTGIVSATSFSASYDGVAHTSSTKRKKN